ncbi:hypothetical protein PFY10_19600 [Chryseobacterium daecheongense]|nr:hypothetical protein PFY10_19600 [Chryseobacterium daecheongense]
MKKIIIITSILLMVISNTFNAQKRKGNILKSSDIAEIEAYLNVSHPDDPKRSILKSRVIDLKNKAWTKGRLTSKPMAARPVIDESELVNKSKDSIKFEQLIKQTPKEHKKKTVKLLNSMFNEDPKYNEAILLFRNKSDCNLILEIEGKSSYSLAIPAQDENFIIITKGVYSLKSNICNTKYTSQKEINKSVILTITPSCQF